MRIAVFSTKPYDREFLTEAVIGSAHECTFFEPRLTEQTVSLAAGFDAVCVFVNDRLTADVVATLASGGVRLIALRCAGFNNVDLTAAADHGIDVVRVPAYSPNSVAEHALALVLALNRRLHRAYNRVREGNFSLEGLMGSDLCGQTVGLIGTGKIGAVTARIFSGLGCKVLAYDVEQSPACLSLGVSYVSLDELFSRSQIISLHCPLMPGTYHLINAATLARMQRGVMIINTSRGGLIDTPSLIEALKTGHVGSVGLDVYEEEADLFFEDLSDKVIQDDVFSRLLTFPNVLITGHQAFFTRNAMQQIAATTVANIGQFSRGERLDNAVTVNRLRK